MTCIKWACGVLAATALAATGACAQAPTDAEILAARDAAQRGNWKPLEQLRARLAGHPLEAYPTYWILSGSVERADPAEVRAFLERYADTPPAESLRREWLKALGGAARWDVFRPEHPKLALDDPEITCYAFQERLSRGDGEVAGEARVFFLAGREAPGSCDPVFAALAASHKVTDTDILDRMRRLLANGLVREAKRTNALLAPQHRIAEKLLDRAAADPGGFLARERAAVLTRTARELALFAVTRLARTKPEEAAERLALIAPRLGPALTQYAWGQVAWQGALNHHPRAPEWYEKAGDTPLGESQVAWKARAAMRAGAWKDVLVAIQALPPAEAREAAWRYWRSRALRALGENEAADGLLKGLAREPSFYGILAAEEIGAVATPEWNGWHPPAAELQRVGALPGVQRALALYRLNLDAEAFREWVWALRGFDDRSLLAAAELARQAGETDRAINTADRTVQLHDYAQRYPIPHRQAIAGAARQWGLDEAMMYALIRQESRFMPDARSRVGATGLMQLMPATARWVARQIPVTPFRPDMLTRPELNVQMGTYYFGRVLAELGHPMLAAAAYNAGPGRARRWRDERALEAAIYAETIPFAETRDYVKKVFANTWFYHHRLTGQLASFRQMLGSVPGSAGEPPEAALAASSLP